MEVGILTLFPEMFSALNYGMPRIAQEKKLLNLQFFNPRDYTQNKHRTVDDKPYGGGPGMVMKVEPLRTALKAAKAKMPAAPHIIYVSPQGKQLDHSSLNRLISRPNIIFIAGRYEGIDERFLIHDIHEEISIGDYVLSGGELAIMVILDGLCRLIPDVLGDENSAQQDSFATGLLDYPHYTRPEMIDDQWVPEELRSGSHRIIARWRTKQALGKTFLKRPDLLSQRQLTAEEQQLLKEFQDELTLEKKYAPDH
jgi:tRNA (guanine37-N1)-methyltransferase